MPETALPTYLEYPHEPEPSCPTEQCFSLA